MGHGGAKYQRMGTIIGHVMEIDPHVTLEIGGKKRQLIMACPVVFKVGEWIRAFGRSRNNMFIVDSYHVVSILDLKNISSFIRKTKIFYSENKLN
ncbi:hypothetical protein NEFER03_1485 [Nematocida sp. LUAm3]|nr:hypothetical protein NEFER03_1485 [Nematocida sp. LUAm3]KAI5174477.1 hypothetical protein NEFER02_0598 [Nematocida sp. LUAm2]KAI5177953.1 hypothetical protein NEFER01_1135 [Nematocida sp. LUAm1]